jgi:hypothetical protein
MSKIKKKLTIISTAIVLAISIALGYLIYKPLFKEVSNIEVIIYDGLYFVSNSECTGNQFNCRTLFDRRVEVVKSQENWKHPLNQVVSITAIENDGDNVTYNKINVIVAYLKRDSIFDQSFEIYKYRNNEVSKIEYEKILEYVKKQDIYKNNPDPENIRNIPPLTPNEINQNKKIWEYLIRDTEVSGYYGLKVNEANKAVKEGNKTKGIELWKSINLETIKALTELDKGNTYTYPDGSKLQPDERTILDLQQRVKDSASVIKELQNQPTPEEVKLYQDFVDKKLNKEDRIKFLNQAIQAFESAKSKYDSGELKYNETFSFYGKDYDYNNIERELPLLKEELLKAEKV